MKATPFKQRAPPQRKRHTMNQKWDIRYRMAAAIRILETLSMVVIDTIFNFISCVMTWSACSFVWNIGYEIFHGIQSELMLSL